MPELLTTDLVPLLRKRSAGGDALLEEAADEIERLREALKLVAGHAVLSVHYRDQYLISAWVLGQARDALTALEVTK